MQNAQVNQANQLIIDADKKLKSWWPFGGNKFEDALELYQKAANLYKMTKNYKEAAEAFVKMTECHLKLNSKYDAASAWADAALAYRKVDPKEAIACQQRAVELYCEMGKFSTAAKFAKELAELYEGDNDLENACIQYQLAADYFDGENQKTSANQCVSKRAHLLATLGKFDDAITAFEKVANDSLDEKLLKWGVKENLFKASICHLSKMQNIESDLDNVKDAVERYKDMDVHFPDSYECRLIDGMIKAMEAKDVKQYQLALKEYDNIKKLDNWLMPLCVNIKSKLEQTKKEVPDLT